MPWLRILLTLFLFSILHLEAAESIERLECKGVTYYKVRVTEVTPVYITIAHQKGLSKLMLENLSPEWQRHFGYDPAKAAEYHEKRRIDAIKAKQTKPPVPLRQPSSSGLKKAPPSASGTLSASGNTSALMGNLLMKFGTPPTLLPEVDLRPRFSELDLVVKNQGRRPSCAIFAVISALEFQNAEVSGKPEPLSEEYLTWATRKSLGLTTTIQSSQDDDADADAGFALMEVVQALRAYGVPLRSQMPNTFGKSMADIPEPDPALINEARTRCTVAATMVTGRDNATRLDNLIHILNTGTPVVAGVRWPTGRAIATVTLLSQQPPRAGYAHAITLVGYQCKTGRAEDAVFIFKNSWGRRWGAGGYGFATYEYLRNNLLDAVVLEVNPPQ